MVKKSNSKSKSKSVKPVKLKVANLKKSVAKKSTVSKKKTSSKRKSISLPPIAQMPSVGELPELPSFEDFAKLSTPSDVTSTSQEIPASQSTDPMSQKPKLWWLSWLLPGKKQPVIDAQSTDVSAKEAADTLTPEESAELAKMPSAEELTQVLSADTKEIVPLTPAQAKKAKKKQVVQEEHIARAYEEVDTLKVRLDEEMRDRQSALEESHAKVKLREAELEKWHDDLQAREKDIVNKEKEYERIKKLEAQVEDKEITLKYKEDEIEDLKNKLAEKELELTQQEDKLTKMSQKIDKAQAQKQSDVAQTPRVADDYQKLAKKHGHVVHTKVEPRKVLSKVVSSVDMPAKREIRNLLLKAYDQLSSNDMNGLQFTYNKIREMYSKMITTAGPDEQLYKDILDLYSDIKLAVMQRS